MTDPAVLLKIDHLQREMEAAGEIPTGEELRAIAENVDRERERLLPPPSMLRRLVNWGRRCRRER